MEILSEIEDELQGIKEAESRNVVEVVSEFEKHSLVDLRQGKDFLMGRDEVGVTVIPIASIRELFGLDSADISDVFLTDFLAAQRVPVRIHYRVIGQRCSSWLLSVNPPWLRLAHPQGVVSIPFGNLDFARVQLSTQTKGRAA